MTAGSLTTVARLHGPTNGPTVLFLHAIALDRHEADWLAGALPDVRVVAFDQRGHGDATASDDEPVTIEALATDALAVASALDLNRFHLVGHSMGGAVAATAARMSGQSGGTSLASLTLIATPSAGGDVFAKRADSLNEQTRDAVIRTTLERWFTPSALAGQDPGVEYATTCLRRIPADRWHQAWMALSGFGGFDALGHTTSANVPVLVISDQDDASTPPSVLEDVRRSIGAKEHITLAGGGHMLVLETPAAVAQALNPHIERTERER